MELKKRQPGIKQQADELKRGWYPAASLWLQCEDHEEEEDVKPATTGSSIPAVEEYIVPADENFLRCPITREAFERVFDDEEGQYLYRNAVKVLVTEKADKSIFELGVDTPSAGVRYLIVNKPFIVDGWISDGRAATLNETKERYSAMGRDSTSIQRLEAALSGGDDDRDDVFVMLELVN